MTVSKSSKVLKNKIAFWPFQIKYSDIYIYKLIFGNVCPRLGLLLDPLARASSNWKQLFIDVKNMYLHRDSNPGLWNIIPIL